MSLNECGSGMLISTAKISDVIHIILQFFLAVLCHSHGIGLGFWNSKNRIKMFATGLNSPFTYPKFPNRFFLPFFSLTHFSTGRAQVLLLCFQITLLISGFEFTTIESDSGINETLRWLLQHWIPYLFFVQSNTENLWKWRKIVRQTSLFQQTNYLHSDLSTAKNCFRISEKFNSARAHWHDIETFSDSIEQELRPHQAMNCEQK